MGDPQIDNFTKGVNNMIPSKIEKLPLSTKEGVIGKSISLVKGEICNKIDGALNIVSSIKSGASDIIGSLGDISLDPSSFFEGPLNDLKGKLGSITKIFDGVSFNLKDQIKNLNASFEGQLDKLLEQQKERLEGTKIASQGFANPLDNIKNISNTKLRDISLSSEAKGSFASGLCGNAEADLASSALSQVSVDTEIGVQNELIDKSNKAWENFNANEMFSETGDIKPNVDASSLTSFKANLPTIPELPSIPSLPSGLDNLEV